MRGSSEDRALALLYAPALLRCECRDDYDSLGDAIQQHQMPRDFIENIWVADMVDGDWETQRLRRFKTAIVKSATQRAIRKLLESLGYGHYDSDYVRNLAKRWFTNKNVRRKILASLRDVDLDEAAVDAEALRLCLPDLTAIDRRLAELALRRDKNLQRIEDHRAGLATRIQASSDIRLNSDAVLSLEHGGT